MNVVCITGKAGHGKDTYAGYLKEALEKRGQRVLTAHYADLVKYVCRTFLGWNGEKDEYGRSLLQRVGTDVFRKKNPDYWVDFIMDVLEAFNGEWDYVLIPDTRFPNEVAVPKERGFETTLVRVTRRGMESALTDEQKKHPSECSMDGVPADIEVYNDWELEDLKAAAEGAAERYFLS